MLLWYQYSPNATYWPDLLNEPHLPIHNLPFYHSYNVVQLEPTSVVLVDRAETLTSLRLQL